MGEGDPQAGRPSPATGAQEEFGKRQRRKKNQSVQETFPLSSMLANR